MRASGGNPDQAPSGTNTIVRAPNPYALAFLTAALAGTFSVVGGYFIAGFQAHHAVAQKQLEYRVRAYEAFLEKVDGNRSPGITWLLSIGTEAAIPATDSEVQEFEDRLGKLLKKYDRHDLYRQLNADLNILRLHGSSRVSKICDDMLKAILLQDDDISWNEYSPEVAIFHEQWKRAQEKGIAYGWEPTISGAERLMIVTVPTLAQALIAQLRHEIQGAP